MDDPPDRLPGHLVVRPACAVCGKAASSIELVPPGGRPVEWTAWPAEHRAVFDEYHDPDAWLLVFAGATAGNGMGDDISAEEAARWSAAFAEPLTYENVRRAVLYDDAGFCAECRVPYCDRHWGVSTGGYGRCPQGHGRSLDPHWSPDDYD
jgi:hypothetical protein